MLLVSDVEEFEFIKFRLLGFADVVFNEGVVPLFLDVAPDEVVGEIGETGKVVGSAALVEASVGECVIGLEGVGKVPSPVFGGDVGLEVVESGIVVINVVEIGELCVEVVSKMSINKELVNTFVVEVGLVALLLVTGIVIVDVLDIGDDVVIASVAFDDVGELQTAGRCDEVKSVTDEPFSIV